MQINHDYYAHAMYTVADPGEGPASPPPLFLDQTEAQKAEKKFLRPPPPPPSSQGLDEHSPPPAILF